MQIIDRSSFYDSDTDSEKSSSEKQKVEIEPLWWLCKHTNGKRVGEQGLVPRNYISFYPIWKYRDSYNFESIELPTEITSTSTQRRKRMLQHAQQQEDHLTLIQWSKVSAAVAAAAAAAQETAKVTATIAQPVTTTNSLTSTNLQKLS